MQVLQRLLDASIKFVGLSRRMERIAANLYSDYAHTPEKIRGAMSVAAETAAQSGQKLIVIVLAALATLAYLKQNHQL